MADRSPFTPAPSATIIRYEVTTYEFDADELEIVCVMNPVCLNCGDSSGSGASGESGTPDPPDGPYTGPCTCPPGYSLYLVGFDPVTLAPIYRCRNALGTDAPCNEDPAGGGGGGGGSDSPTLTIELTEFDVPGEVRAVGVRCVDVSACEVCA